MKKMHRLVFGLTLTAIFIAPNGQTQNVGAQDLQKFQQLMQDNGGRGSQQSPMQQPENAQDKDATSQLTEEEMANLQMEEERTVREKPKNLLSVAEPKLLNNELNSFGYDLFEKAPTTYAPATDIPVSPNYIIGPGDNVEVLLYGNQSDDFTLQVNREGEVYFPSIGPISVAGLTFQEMKSVLLQRIENQLIGVEASITLGILKSIQVHSLPQTKLQSQKY